MKTPEAVEGENPQALFLRVLRQRLVSLRMHHDLSATEAARMCSLSRGGLEKIESGANAPSLESLMKLCSLYGVPLSSVFLEAEAQRDIAVQLSAGFSSREAEQQEALAQISSLARVANLQKEWESALCLAKISAEHPDLAKNLHEIIGSMKNKLKKGKAKKKVTQRAGAEGRS